MAVGSGQYGTFHVGASELLEVNNWKLTRKAAIHEYATNNTEGYKKTVAGTKSGSGSVSGIYDGQCSDLTPGDDVAVKLYYSAAGSFDIDVTVESFDVEVDIDDGAPVSWECSFITDGDWS